MILKKAYLLAKLAREQRMSKEQLRRHQLKALKKIVKHAYETVPYYHQLFKRHNIHPDDIKTLEDINKIPITTKETIKKLPKKDRISSACKPSKILYTSGSTGIPMEIYISKYFSDLRDASIHLTYLSSGYKLTKKIAYLQFHPPNNRISPILKKINIPIDLPLDKQIELLKKIQPFALEGYTGRINAIAKKIEQGAISPKVIILNSENTTPNIRKNIVKKFGTKPTVVYDSWEFGNIAWECKKGSLHINSNLLFLQVQKDGKDVLNTKGDIIITDFYNYASPLIRYAIEDIGVMSNKECKCNKHFPVLKSIDGRKSNNFITKDNKIKHYASIEIEFAIESEKEVFNIK